MMAAEAAVKPSPSRKWAMAASTVSFEMRHGPADAKASGAEVCRFEALVDAAFLALTRVKRRRPVRLAFAEEEAETRRSCSLEGRGRERRALAGGGRCAGDGCGVTGP